MLERKHRTQIFDKILKDSTGHRAPMPRKKLSVTTEHPVLPNVPLSPQDEMIALEDKAERAVAHGDYLTAADELERAIRLAVREKEDAIRLIDLHLSHASALIRCDEFDTAEEALNQAEAALELGSMVSLAEQQVDILAHRAVLSCAEGHFKDAITEYQDAIQIYERDCDALPTKKARLRSDLGGVYVEAELMEQALEIVLEAVTVLENAGEPAPEASVRVFRQMANIAFKKNEPSAAVNHLLEAYRYAQQLESSREMIELEVTLATVYTQYGEYSTACRWFEAAIKRQENRGSTERWPLGLLYANLAMVRDRTDESADDSADCFSRSVDLQLTPAA